MADDLFDQADLNKDQRIDYNEFRTFITQNLTVGPTNFAANAIGGGQYTTSAHESSLSAGYGDVANVTGAGAAGGEASYSSYEQSSYGSALDAEAGGLETSTSSGFDVGSLGANTFSGANLTTGAVGLSSSSTFEASSSLQQVQVDPDNPKNLYQDPNPQIIRRPAQGGQLTYTQNIKIRFLQPPPIPPPGPLIIKEVRPPQPPPPPPLRIRQQAPPLPQPPPLVLRERPPVPPASVAPQTVIRRLAALPVPPRSVIIERLPPLPPKPRDIIIERWIPYGAQAKRKTIVQRAAAATGYPKPRNIIIQYEPIQVRIIRQFQRLGVTQENPQVYIQRYGVLLLDAQTLIQQARAAGVIEDISPPINASITAASSSSFSAEFNSANSGIETVGDVNLAAAGNTGASVSSFESASYGGDQQENASFSGFESAQGAGLVGGLESVQGAGLVGGLESVQGAGLVGGLGSVQGAGVVGDFSSAYESSSISSQGVAGAAFGGATTSGYENYSASAVGTNINNTDAVTAAFLAADLNKDGRIDPHEFRLFLKSQFQYQQ